MRAVVVPVLTFVWLLAGCATPFESGQFHPIPRAPASPGLPYAQVREYAISAPAHLVWWSFEANRPRRQAAVTLDVRNDTATPLLLELSRAKLRHQADGKLTDLPVAAAGMGNIPRTIDLQAPGEPALELAPGEGRTLWLAFAPPETDESPGKLLVVVPVTAAGEVLVPIHDEVASPRLHPQVTSTWGFNLGTSARLFDSATGRFNQVELALFYARQSLTASVVGGAFTLHERLRGGIGHAGGPSLALDLAWRPLDFSLGAFASAHHQWIDFDTGAGEPDRKLFGATVGLLFPVTGGIAPPGALRVGYTHLFGAQTPYHGGLFASLEIRLFRR